MRLFFVPGAVVMAALVVPAAFAADVESGIEVGGVIEPYTTVKCGGIEDGVPVGDSLCYT